MEDVTSNLDRAKLGSQKHPSNLPGNSSGAQSNPSIASLSKKDLKKQRQKERRRAKWLAANQPETRGSEPGDPSLAEHDSATSTEPKYLENTNPNASDVLDTPMHLIDPAISRLDFSFASIESDPAITHPDPPAISSEQKHHTDGPLALPTECQDTSEDLSSARSDVAAPSTGPESLFHNPNFDEVATSESAFENTARAFENTSRLDFSFASTGSDPAVTHPDPPAISSEQKHHTDGPLALPTQCQDTSEDLSSARSDVAAPSTGPESLFHNPNFDEAATSESAFENTARAFENTSRLDFSFASTESDPAITHPDPPAISTEQKHHTDGPLALPTECQDTSEDLSSARSDVAAPSTGPESLFRNPNFDEAATSESAFENTARAFENTARALEDTASAKSDDHDSSREFYTPPENTSSVDHHEGLSGVSETDPSSNPDGNITSTETLIRSESDLVKSESDSTTPRASNTPENSNSSTVDHREGLSGVSEIGSSSNSDDNIASTEALVQSESDSVSPQTCSAPNSSNIATPNITSSAAETSASAKDQIDDDTSLRKESSSTSTKEPMNKSAQRSTSKSTKERTHRSVRFLLEDSQKSLPNPRTRTSAGRSRDEEAGKQEHTISEELVSNSSGSTDSSEGSSGDSIREPHQEGTKGVMGLKWAYATHTVADKMLLARGIWLFQSPVAAHFRMQPYVWKKRGLGVTQASVIIRSRDHTLTTPAVEFDGQIVHINAHGVPWADVRSARSHPDAQLSAKLAEYQAAEAMGLHVWRHDRNFLDCRLSSCRAKLADHSPAGVVCLGCGPKTIIRYCSVAHMVVDLKEHWLECGSADLVLKRVVDHTTAPARFGHLCPAIRDSHNTKSYALFRQGLYRILNGGRYTLFDWVTEEPTALEWTKQDVRSREIERRVERLLNFALFDQRNQVVVGFLFRLLRQCLQLKNSWSKGTIHALQKQFGEEFGFDGSMVVADWVCECEWVGEGLPEALHLPACRRLYRDFGPDFHGSGVKDYLEKVEARWWILRAWQQQHAVVGHWSDRVAGEGFKGEVKGTSPVLGPGWTGWGAGEDDRSL